MALTRSVTVLCALVWPCAGAVLGAWQDKPAAVPIEGRQPARGAAAQIGPPQPAAELAKLEPMLGSFEGEGVVTEGPGAKKTRWRSRSHVRKGFGGHWLVEDTVIEFDADMKMPALYFRSFTGFDRERRRFVTLMLSNMGTVSKADLDVLGGGRFAHTSVRRAEGRLVVERSISTYDARGCRFKSMYGRAGAPEITMLEGTLRRVEKVEVGVVEAAFPPEIPKERIEALAPLFGRYELEGSMVPAPGAPKIPVSGVEEISPICGGQLVAFEAQGAPVGDFSYRGFVALAWNGEESRYEAIYVNNVGEGGWFEAALDPARGALVFVRAGPMMGVLSAQRSVLRFTRKAGLIESIDLVAPGAGRPYTAFAAEFRRTRR